MSQTNLSETMLFENPQYFMMPKCLCRGGKARLPGRGMREVVGCKCLKQSCLAITTGSEDYALRVVGRTSAYNDVDSALLARIFARRRSCLHRVGHLGELFLPFRFG